MSVNFAIGRWARKQGEVVLGKVEKEEIESAAQEILGDVEIQGRISVHKKRK